MVNTFDIEFKNSDKMFPIDVVRVIKVLYERLNKLATLEGLRWNYI